MKIKNPFQSVHDDPKFLIKRNINSLNCDYPFPNAERIAKEERKNLLSYHYTKWAMIVVLGIIIGFIILGMTLFIEEVTLLKTRLFIGYIFPLGEVAAIPIYLVFTVCFSILSSLPVLFWHPTVQGVGVPETMSYLNGIDIPGLEDLTQIPARLSSTLLMIIAGLPGGQTEALLPIGITVASNLALLKLKGFRVFPNHRYDSDRRDFGGVGLGAAASANFGTPLGGVFFVLQQLSTWHAGITFIIIVSSLMASYLFITIYNVIRDVDDRYNNANSFFSPFESQHKPDFNLSEFPTFILMSVIGGSIGSFWVFIHGQLSRFRVRYVKGKIFALVEIAIVSIIIALPALLLVFHHQQCAEKLWINNFGERIVNLLNYQCAGDDFNVAELVLLANPETVVRTILILPDDQLSLSFTFLAFGFVFIASALHLGTHTTNGVIVPNMLMGALWGRIFKVVVADVLFEPETAKMTKYSFLGAVAQIAGVTQYSIAFGVMMAETVGVVNFALPVFIVIFCGRYMAQMICSGIYGIISCVKGYPILLDTAPPLCLHLTTKDVMSKRVVALPMSMSVGKIKAVLEKYQHLEFPVMEIGDVLDAASGEPVGLAKGIILRKQLVPLLNEKRKESVMLLMESEKKMLDKGDLPQEAVIDIGHFMNHQPYHVHQDFPLTRLHSLFESLNIHTLLVVNESHQLVGLVTRKDFSGFKVENRLYAADVFYRPAEA